MSTTDSRDTPFWYTPQHLGFYKGGQEEIDEYNSETDKSLYDFVKIV